jgi:hypothetical protein
MYKTTKYNLLLIFVKETTNLLKWNKCSLGPYNKTN